MPPTIQTAVGSGDKRPVPTPQARPAEKRAELVTRVKYCNTLPDIPFDPKFVTYPFESTRFIQYKPTSLERNYKYEVLAEHDLGVTIDLINSDTYAHDPIAILSPYDEKLLEEDILTPQDTRRSRHHAKSVSWLRRTEYISTEQTRFQPQTMDKVEAKVGYSIKKAFKDETLYMDRDSQIQAIEKTFHDAKTSLEKHYSKPALHPVEILPVFPDFKLWKYPCAQVIFDSDPAPVGRSVPAQIEEMSQAMIRGVMDESGEQFVAYFLPTEETMEQRRADLASDNPVDYSEETHYTYKMAREYNWNVKSKASKGYEENYFLVVRQDGVYYNELETRVRLHKRRQKQGQIQASNTKLVVSHRPLTANEFNMQRFREKMLEPPGEEEDEEEVNKSGEEEEQEGGEKMDVDQESNRSHSDQEGSDKESNRDEGSDADASDREGSDADASDREASEKDASDREASEKDASDREASEKDASDREASDKEESDREASAKEGSERDDSDRSGNEASDREEARGSEKEHHSGDEAEQGDGKASPASSAASTSSSSSSDSDYESD